MKKFLAAAVFVLCSAGASLAWPQCNGNWIQVPAGTSSANGAVVTEGGQTFQCQPVAPPTTPSTSNNSSNSTSNSSSNSSSQSNSNSNSSSKATGGNATAVGQGGAGGSVNNSGNSSNTNVNTAQGGAGGNANQKQTQSQTATGGTATANGNGNNSNDTNVVYPRQVATAVAPEVFPTVPCFKGFSGGVQSTAFGASFGGGKIDENCAELEAARQAPTRIARCKVYLLNKYVQKAGVTLEDCLGPSAVPERTVERQQLVAPAPQIVVNVPAINVPAPVIIEQQVPAPALPVAAKPLPPPVKQHPVKQHHVVKPCAVSKCSEEAHKVWDEDEVERLDPAKQ